jgi:hypothetical protein
MGATAHMQVRIEDWQNGWSGISIGIAENEIDHLIELLRGLQADSGQHFHIRSDYKESGGVGDIEIYIKKGEEADNMTLSSMALAPGTEIELGEPGT